MTRGRRGVLRRIAGMLRPHWRLVLVFALTTAAVSAADGGFTFIGKAIIDDAIAPRDTEALVRLALVFGALALVQACATYAAIYSIGWIGERVGFELRRRMFAHLQRLSLSYYDRTAVGWIVARVTSDTERLTELVSWAVLDGTYSILNIAAAVVFMLIIDWRLALLVIAVIPLLVFVAIRFRVKIVALYRRVRRLNSRITGAYNEAISGVRVIKALGREDANAAEFGRLTGRMKDAAYRAAFFSGLFHPSVQLLMALGLGAIVLYSGGPGLSRGISVGSVQAFFGYTMMMLWPIQEVARLFAEMQQAMASAERIFALLDAPVEVADRPGASDQPLGRGAICFEGVDFAYVSDQPILRDFELEIPAGQTVALVGPTGGGKTTIVSLVARFYEPSAGRITIGGRDYASVTLRAHQSRLGMVLQSPHLFSGSIADNIRFGRREADDAAVEAAARATGAHEFITALPHGYESAVGEGGTLLSVGQKQLISLARAFLIDPDIFILDEATSSIDSLSERLIQQSISRLMHGRISFVIAHRLSTIERADRILVIEGGRIIEHGTHRQLLARGDRYQRLYASQLVQSAAQSAADSG